MLKLSTNSGYVDLDTRTITMQKVFYNVRRHNHNLFSVGQFCDAIWKFSFRKSTCYIRDLKGNDLLTGSRGTDLYSISLQDSTSPNPICLMAKATSSQAWLWHRRLSHLNFDTINLLSKNNIVNGLPKLKFVKDHLCSSCELGKAKRKSFHSKTTPSSKRRLQLLHMDLCGPMRVESINGKKYVLVIVDDFSRYTWTHFLRSKDETPGVLIDFLTLVQRGLHAQRELDTKRQLLDPEQNGVVERRNRTLVEAARTMLSAAKVPLFFWAEAIATACFTQNRSLVIPRHEKTPYHIINARKPSSSAVHAADNPDKRQQHNTTHTSTTTDVADPPPLNLQSTHQTPTQLPIGTTHENIIQAETITENALLDDDEFSNNFSTTEYKIKGIHRLVI
ncbi:retrovirus-related pol polyprotein from transposon TNT 1-94 [Tanacetum coccineum]|uniref:Retrovirus-related pol polyprotein from transposon TNT 1-94 n=1 Tax=Tanacetum coccineum TaxID=301880 RepID=A0ABQ5GM66_9ASTR